jgi:hypothetical protein
LEDSVSHSLDSDTGLEGHGTDGSLYPLQMI